MIAKLAMVKTSTIINDSEKSNLKKGEIKNYEFIKKNKKILIKD